MMKINFTRPTIYMSHPIRGSNGDVEGNCKKAMAAARRLRRVFPEVDFYVPAEHDLILQVLWKFGIIDESDILDADAIVVAACDGWFSYAFDDSHGSDFEMEVATNEALRLYDYDIIKYDIEKAAYRKIRDDFSPIVYAAVDWFKERQRERNSTSMEKQSAVKVSKKL